MFEILISSLFVTIAAIVILLLFFRHKVVWWEFLIMIAVSLLSGAIFKWAATSGLTKDTEYWGTRFEKVEYYEDWDEWIEQTCSETCCCDEDGMNCITTYYDCSYRDYHPAYWVKVDHLGNRYSISQSEYIRLKKKMKNTKFKDLRRDYYRKDGDMHYTVWNKKMQDYECITTIHTYENKTQAVPNVFNYDQVDSFDIASYGLYDYPEPTGSSRYYQKNILGYSDPKAEHQLQILNGELGHTKQVKVFILVYRNQPLEASNKQEAYWKGGNKNEVVITINIDDNDKPTWCRAFSWSDKETFKIEIRDYVIDQEKLNLSDIVSYTKAQIVKDYKRKEFSDFDYLEVKLTGNQMTWGIILSIFINMLVSLFVVLNPFEDGWQDRGRNMYPWNQRRRW